MGQITVDFIGVCTHLQRQVTGVLHRVVLVEGAVRDTDGNFIAPHIPSLDSNDVSEGNLPKRPGRVTLTIANATGAPIESKSYDRDYTQAIWSLKKFTKDNSLGLNPAVSQGKANPASLYFDTGHGTFGACLAAKGGASVARLTIPTDGVPHLRIEWWDRPASSDVIFKETAVLRVMNLSDPPSCDNRDFLLHYSVTNKSFNKYPDKKAACEGCATCEPGEIPIVDLGPGCSNSNYP